MAAAGENTVKIYNMHTWKEIKNERIEMPKSSGKITKLQWASNGQLLVVATAAGHLYGYLTSVPNLTSVYLDWVCMLTSFTEVTIMDCSKIGEAVNVMVVNLESEPAILTNGPFHLAAGINNMVWYYLWYDNIQGKLIKGKNLLMKRDYLGSVKRIVMNGHWAAVFIDGGRCVLHPLNLNNDLALDQEK
jgi:WD repeat-containing protein 19